MTWTPLVAWQTVRQEYSQTGRQADTVRSSDITASSSATDSPDWSGGRKSTNVDRVEVRPVQVGGGPGRLRLQHLFL